MSRTTYNVQHTYTGANNKLDYTFSFKIEELSQLLVVQRNASLVETSRVLGTDTSVLIDTVVFDAEAGGGTVNLLVNLPTGYKLDIFLANDAPTQGSMFRNKTDFSMPNIENALDWIAGAVQRVSFLSQRSVKLEDYLSLASFDPTLPADIIGESQKVFGTNTAGDGFEMGPSFADIEAAETYATSAASAQTAAETAQTASETAQAASEVAQAAAEAAQQIYQHSVTGGQSATDLTDETFDASLYTAVFYNILVIRGTTLVDDFEVRCHNVNGTWRTTQLPSSFGPTGVTITNSQTTTIGQLKTALTAGDNGYLQIKKHYFTTII